MKNTPRGEKIRDELLDVLRRHHVVSVSMPVHGDRPGELDLRSNRLPNCIAEVLGEFGSIYIEADNDGEPLPELERELAELRAASLDTKRMDWMEKHKVGRDNHWARLLVWQWRVTKGSTTRLRAAIDAEMKELPE